MDQLKKAIKKHKIESRFRRAGEPHRLTSDDQASMSAEEREAARRAAALEAEAKREEARKRDAQLGSSLSAIRRQVKKEMEKEAQDQHQVVKPQIPAIKVDPMLWTCLDPLVEDPMTEKQIMKAIEESIAEAISSQSVLTDFERLRSAWILFAITNRPVEQARELLCTYIDNIRGNSEDPKFRRIRLGNKVYASRLAQLRFINDLMESLGFKLDSTNENDPFWFMDEGLDEFLEIAKDMLGGPIPTIQLIPYRKTRYFPPNSSGNPELLDEKFFALTIDELKKRQQMFKDKVEFESTLMTKRQREAALEESLNKQRSTEYTIIRIKMPDGAFVDARFMPLEKFADIVEYVKSSLMNDQTQHFALTSNIGTKVVYRSEEGANSQVLEKSLKSIGLDPNGIVYLTIENTPIGSNPQSTLFLSPTILNTNDDKSIIEDVQDK